MKNKKQEKIYENAILKIILLSIVVFAFGIFVGYQLNNEKITSIQGYLFNALGFADEECDEDATDSNATDSNATDSNATDSNATDSNATDSNATDSNATDSNATNCDAEETDYILYLTDFKLSKLTITQGEKLNITLETTGAYNVGGSIVFENTETKKTFSSKIESDDNSKYVTIPTTANGTYTVKDVLLTGLNSDDTTFTKQFSNNITSGSDISLLGYYEKLQIKAIENKQEVKKVALESISIVTNEAKQGENIYLKYKANMSLESMQLVFNEKNTDNTISVYVKSIDDNPYFVLPTDIKATKYVLTKVTLISDSQNVIYTNNSKDENYFNFNAEFNCLENDKNKLVYNNDELTDAIISKIYNSDDNTAITLNSENNPIINKELFNAIKGTNKTLTVNYNDNQFVFNGNDVDNPKSIDVSVNATNSYNDEKINKLLSNGIVLNLASNGNLPAKALLRIKATNSLKATLNKNIYVYYYNQTENKFNVIAENISLTNDNYYEFNIDHTSKYVMTNQKLDDSLLTDAVYNENDEIVDFQKSNKVNWLVIGCGMIVIVFATLLVIYLKPKKNKDN